FAHKPIVGYYVVEKLRTYQNKNKKTIIVSKGNYNRSSQQMEHEALKAIINDITPTLEKFQMLLEIGIDEDLNSNKTLEEQRVVYKICADLKHKAKLIRTKIEPNLKMVSKNECDELNEAINHIKLNYTDKKTNYPKLYSARHALAVLHNNYGLIEVLKITRQATQKNELRGFDYSQDLVPYRKHIKDQIKTYQFKPSFADLIPNWATFIKCEGYYSFPKRFPNGLCILCSFYFNNDLLSQIPNELYHLNLAKALLDKSSLIKTNPLNTILPETGSGKTLIYAVASILFEGLTVIFSPLKSLMEDQLRELINVNIPTMVLYTSSLQPPNIQSQIFGELSAKMIKILLITGEKYVENIKLRSMLQNLSISYKIQFVIDEAHCINQLERLKSDFSNVPVLLLTAMCSQIIAQKIMTSLNRFDFNIIRNISLHRTEILLEVIPKPSKLEKLLEKICKSLDTITSG
ncbi:9939_t:CDS:2, partial [Gigaspora margarita]